MKLAVAFSLAEQRFALPVQWVEQVVRAVAVTPLPKAPPVVRGIIDFRGEVVPVMDIRQRLDLPSRPMALSDQIIIARASGRHIAFCVEAIIGVVEWDGADFVATNTIVSGVEFLDGVVRNQEGMILVYDPDAFFLPAEQLMLDQAMGQDHVHG
ncbi:chemotaxis protein CheW [Denitratisoma oestradiolicum]|uniref:CheW protein n=1 Tax=Denitratisoma oestradiolicum TaxID=311182 RepID=A0A6S6YNW6_9PROT|nr:chemotaxis protein CheW [Denitratisoma oestradiolicum]TWO78898.1 hypothetical protein CBW56_17715 [Denitratisoma oestradiolicum]CAB1369448.1 CheW protein [Denitratisoma oestradiolicum]